MHPSKRAPAKAIPPSSSLTTSSESKQRHPEDPSPKPPGQKTEKQPSPSGTRNPGVKEPSLANNHSVFFPRPYESLYTERAYLATALQGQSAKRSDLIQQYATTRHAIETTQPSQHRKLNRRQFVLRGRISEASTQEQVIFLRLSELYVELKSREAWERAEAQQRRQLVIRQQPYSPSTISSAVSSSRSNGTAATYFSASTAPSTPLNPETPDFVPRSERYTLCETHSQKPRVATESKDLATVEERE